MKEIRLTQEKVTLVDDEDFEALNKFKWYFVKNATGNCHVFRRWERDCKVFIRWMHREILGLPAEVTEQKTDHRDGNGLNNQRHNLRPATRLQNSGNRKKFIGKYSSKYKGVGWYKKGGNWRAFIRVNAVLKFLGGFEFEEKAAQAYDAAARRHFGEFANCNFPITKG